MKNEYKEIEYKLRKTLEVWFEILQESNEEGWSGDLDFTLQDAYNAISVMTTICCSIAIKNGIVKTPKEIERIKKNLNHFLDDSFGIDFNGIKNLKS